MRLKEAAIFLPLNPPAEVLDEVVNLPGRLKRATMESVLAQLKDQGRVSHAAYVERKSVEDLPPHVLTKMVLLVHTNLVVFLDANARRSTRGELQEDEMQFIYIVDPSAQRAQPDRLLGFAAHRTHVQEDGYLLNVGYLFQLHVESDIQEMGLGSALLNEVEDAALRAGHRTLLLTAFAGNESVRGFYSKRDYSVAPHSPTPPKEPLRNKTAKTVRLIYSKNLDNPIQRNGRQSARRLTSPDLEAINLSALSVLCTDKGSGEKASRVKIEVNHKLKEYQMLIGRRAIASSSVCAVRVVALTAKVPAIEIQAFLCMDEDDTDWMREFLTRFIRRARRMYINDDVMTCAVASAVKQGVCPPRATRLYLSRARVRLVPLASISRVLASALCRSPPSLSRTRL